MLSLFQDQLPIQSGPEVQKLARDILISYLNKGVIPNWEAFFQELPVLNDATDLLVIKNNFEMLIDWPFLKDLLSLEGTEFFFHGIKTSQRLLHNGNKTSIPIPLSEEDWQLWLEIISIRFSQNWNVKQPFVSFYGELFGKHYRLSLIHGSTSPLGVSKLVIRSLASTPHSLNSFGEEESLKKIIREKKNFLVAGSTGSGKTSLLSTLIQEISPSEHLVILEDTYEIISSHQFQTRLLAGDTPETSLKAYLSYCLRLSPERIVLGEMRSHEVIPFLMSMNTGHKGLMGTIHASSAVDALNRVALLFMLYAGEANLTIEKVMELLCRNLEYIVYMENKKVKEIIKVLGSENGIPFYEKESAQEIIF